MSLIDDLGNELGKANLPAVHIGDTVKVHYLIKEGDKERVQIFTGTILAIQGRGVAKSIVVRRIDHGEGVEWIFPLHSPRVKDVTITRRGNVRQARLYYLRDRVGKQTRVQELVGSKARRKKEAEEAARAAAEAPAPTPAESGESADESSEEADAVEV